MREATMAISFKGAHFPKEVILMGIRWYVAYPLSTRHVEELMEEREWRWITSPLTAGSSSTAPAGGRMPLPQASGVGELAQGRNLYQSHGEWCYLYRAVDKQGQTIDFLLTEHRDTEAPTPISEESHLPSRVPETITIDGSDANEAAIKSYNEEQGTNIIIRQVKYLHNIVEQDHRGVKRVTRPLLGFKLSEAAQ
jgi:putative transposase